MTRHATYGRFSYLASNAFELFLCGLTLYAAIQFVVSPDALYESTVGRLLHPWDYAWIALYGVSSALVVFGLVLPSPRLEVAGLLGYAAGVLVNLIALVALVGNQSVIGICTYSALSLAALVRAHYVYGPTRRA